MRSNVSSNQHGGWGICCCLSVVTLQSSLLYLGSHLHHPPASHSQLCWPPPEATKSREPVRLANNTTGARKWLFKNSSHVRLSLITDRLIITHTTSMWSIFLIFSTDNNMPFVMSCERVISRMPSRVRWSFQRGQRLNSPLPAEHWPSWWRSSSESVPAPLLRGEETHTLRSWSYTGIYQQVAVCLLCVLLVTPAVVNHPSVMSVCSANRSARGLSGYWPNFGNVQSKKAEFYGP